MRVAAAAVVVPAHDEADLIVACVRAIRTAAARIAPLPVVTVVVADACADATAALAAREGAHVLEIRGHNVGAARAAGARHALDLLGLAPGTAGPDIWLAMTDADSTVPAHWLARQLAWARRGHDAVLGTIRLAPAPHPGHRRARNDRHDAAYYRTRPARQAGAPWEHPHIHGANMGVSAAAYRRVGGFAALTTGEDRDLAVRLAAAGYRIARADDHPVRTADRLRGRAPGGLADLLASLERPSPPPLRTVLPSDAGTQCSPIPHGRDR
ncbi:glycosyltransferase [Streptomyces sp. NPDC047123]|uniref:glycosyltransferase n=1 Tax=Streptomyces sp. NPDC047123 TaxID=3155622 RepID=UPI0033ED6BE3